MPDLEINNQREFYDKIVLDENGFVVIELVTQTGAENNPLNAKEFYEDVALNSEGYLKIFE